MATSAEIRQVSQLLARLPEQIQLCESLALALLEVGEPLFATGWYATSEYQRGREQVRNTVRDAWRLVERIRRDTLSPQLIRARAHVAKVQTCCDGCPTANAKCHRQTSFRCLAKERLGSQPLQFRFELGKGGQIHERK